MGLTLPGQETVYVHPTFLYESLWNFAGFLMLHFWFRKHERRFDGELILLYAVWYGIGRALIEGLRTDSLYITGTGIRVSQLLAGVSGGGRRRRARAALHRQAPASAALCRPRERRGAAGCLTFSIFFPFIHQEVLIHERLP